METGKLWNAMLEEGIVSEETLQVITSINGYSVETLNDVLYAVTGYRDWEQYKESI